MEHLCRVVGSNKVHASYYPPAVALWSPNGWTVRFVCSFSLGKAKAEALSLLCEQLHRLIQLDLPDLSVDGRMTAFEFS
ncbi:MAG: hypothetical protein R3Y59_02880 [bacterium]